MTALGKVGTTSRLEINSVTVTVLDLEGNSLISFLGSKLEEDVVLDTTVDIVNTTDGSIGREGVSTIGNSLQRSSATSNGGLGALDNGSCVIVIAVVAVVLLIDDESLDHVIVDHSINLVVRVGSDLLVGSDRDLIVGVDIVDVSIVGDREGITIGNFAPVILQTDLDGVFLAGLVDTDLAGNVAGVLAVVGGGTSVLVSIGGQAGDDALAVDGAALVEAANVSLDPLGAAIGAIDLCGAVDLDGLDLLAVNRSVLEVVAVLVVDQVGDRLLGYRRCCCQPCR